MDYLIAAGPNQLSSTFEMLKKQSSRRPEWAPWYALLNVDPGLYDGLLVEPVDAEILAAIRKLPNRKSGGTTDLPTGLFSENGRVVKGYNFGATPGVQDGCCSPYSNLR